MYPCFPALLVDEVRLQAAEGIGDRDVKLVVRLRVQLRCAQLVEDFHRFAEGNAEV